MSGPRVWLPAPGVALVHRSAGFPMPPLDHDARAALDEPPVSKWPWQRQDIWPCQHVEPPTADEPWLPFRTCHWLAVWRVADSRTRGYYCPAHVPTKPHGDPVSLCATCVGPIDPAIPSHSHPCCDPAGDVDYATALANLRAILERHAS